VAGALDLEQRGLEHDLLLRSQRIEVDRCESSSFGSYDGAGEAKQMTRHAEREAKLASRPRILRGTKASAVR